MNYVKVKILPRPYNIEFKQLGKLIFDINYVEYTKFETKMWCNSKEQAHRENGPALIWDDGDQWWWLNGIRYSEEEFNKEIRRRNELCKHSSFTKTL